MAWLPGQTCVGSACDVVNVQISPSRLTTAAHIRAPLNKPPAVGLAASMSFCLNSLWLGSSVQFAAKRVPIIETPNTQQKTTNFRTILNILRSYLKVDSSVPGQPVNERRLTRQDGAIYCAWACWFPCCRLPETDRLQPPVMTIVAVSFLPGSPASVKVHFADAGRPLHSPTPDPT